MFGLDLIMAGLLTLASDEIVCQSKKSPEVAVTPSKSRIAYDYSKSRDELQQFDIDTVSPYGVDMETHVGGLMSGEILMESEIAFYSDRYVAYDASCLYIGRVSVKMHINPVIYIANDYPKRSCEHEAILDHEKKHIKADRLIVNKYSDRIAKTISYALSKYGTAFGPMPSGDVKAAQVKLKEYVEGMIEEEAARMNVERRDLQQSIDSLEEYERVKAMCR